MEAEELKAHLPAAEEIVSRLLTRVGAAQVTAALIGRRRGAPPGREAFPQMAISQPHLGAKTKRPADSLRWPDRYPGRTSSRSFDAPDSFLRTAPKLAEEGKKAA